MTLNEAEPAARIRRPRRGFSAGWSLVLMMTLLFGVPWWTLIIAGNHWPIAVVVLGTVVFVAAAAAFPPMMVIGHARHRDWAALIGDTLLGVIWVLFTWSVIGNVLRLGLILAGVANPARSRFVVVFVLVVSAALLAWGSFEARRVPRVREVEVTLPRLGVGLDGLRIVLLTDTHYGPIDRVHWSAAVVDRVNTLDADLVCHTGDIADGTVAVRRAQAVHLGRVRARYARAYVTGNHEYFGDAPGWLDYMAELGWESLHNRHLVLERDGAQLVVAGVDDATAAASGKPGHRADHAAALDGADPRMPVLLLAHQPRMISHAVEHGVDLQISGHTHGGQIWPFHLLVRTDQPVLHGLTRHGTRTQLYTSRGTGFWGPPFRVFAPAEITLITLRAARG